MILKAVFLDIISYANLIGMGRKKSISMHFFIDWSEKGMYAETEDSILRLGRTEDPSQFYKKVFSYSLNCKIILL